MDLVEKHLEPIKEEAHFEERDVGIDGVGSEVRHKSEDLVEEENTELAEEPQKELVPEARITGETNQLNESLSTQITDIKRVESSTYFSSYLSDERKLNEVCFKESLEIAPKGCVEPGKYFVSIEKEKAGPDVVLLIFVSVRQTIDGIKQESTILGRVTSSFVTLEEMRVDLLRIGNKQIEHNVYIINEGDKYHVSVSSFDGRQWEKKEEDIPVEKQTILMGEGANYLFLRCSAMEGKKKTLNFTTLLNDGSLHSCRYDIRHSCGSYGRNKEELKTIKAKKTVCSPGGVHIFKWILSVGAGYILEEKRKIPLGSLQYPPVEWDIGAKTTSSDSEDEDADGVEVLGEGDTVSSFPCIQRETDEIGEEESETPGGVRDAFGSEVIADMRHADSASDKTSDLQSYTEEGLTARGASIEGTDEEAGRVAEGEGEGEMAMKMPTGDADFPASVSEGELVAPGEGQTGGDREAEWGDEGKAEGDLEISASEVGAEEGDMAEVGGPKEGEWKEEVDRREEGEAGAKSSRESLEKEEGSEETVAEAVVPGAEVERTDSVRSSETEVPSEGEEEEGSREDEEGGEEEGEEMDEDGGGEDETGVKDGGEGSSEEEKDEEASAEEDGGTPEEVSEEGEGSDEEEESEGISEEGSGGSESSSPAEEKVPRVFSFDLEGYFPLDLTSEESEGDKLNEILCDIKAVKGDCKRVRADIRREREKEEEWRRLLRGPMLQVGPLSWSRLEGSRRIRVPRHSLVFADGKVDQNPIPLEYRWREDPQLLSAYNSCKIRRRMDIRSYAANHEEIIDVISDFLLFVFINKPEDVIAFTKEYFMDFK